jgi:transposase
MEAIVEKCCGLDVHQATVVACLVVGAAHEQPRKESRTYGTTTRELKALRAWLLAEGCTTVGMESTGVYWKPVYTVLEGSFDIIVGNAHHMKNVPGRKTDMKDAEWIAHLIRLGLVARSFVPPKPIRELRDLLRYRTKLVQARSAEENRLMALLERANIKLSSVMARVLGVSGKQMLHALIDGETDLEKVADMAKGRLRKKLPQLREALDGYIEEHHRFILTMQLDRVERMEADVGQLDARIDEKLAPYHELHERLMQIPGVDRVVAAVIVAEIGPDMTVFHGPHALAAWAGTCPGNNESAGKRYGGKARKGNVHLRSILVQAATAAGRQKGTYLHRKYHRLRARLGPKRAALAVAHRILVSAYHMISRRQDYKDLGDAYLDQISEARVTKGLIARLERLGYDVTLAKRAA